MVCFDGKWKCCEFLHTFIWSSTVNPSRVNPISRNIGQPELSKNEGGWVFLWPNNECRAWIVSTGGHHSSSQIFWMHEKIGWLEAHEASTLDIWSCENLTTSKIQLSILTRCRGNVRWMLVSAFLWMLEKLPTIRQGKFLEMDKIWNNIFSKSWSSNNFPSIIIHFCDISILNDFQNILMFYIRSTWSTLYRSWIVCLFGSVWNGNLPVADEWSEAGDTKSGRGASFDEVSSPLLPLKWLFLG